MQGATFPYQQAIPLADVPMLEANTFMAAIMETGQQGWRLAALFALPDSPNAQPGLCALLAKDKEFCVLRTPPLTAFPSIARECPGAQLFERVIYEENGIVPEGHPWLKPVRKAPDVDASEMSFYRVQGAQIHEVGVGPVHAGIIEPGHFRFQCLGEKVLNLEIALGYQHRGIENALLLMPARTGGNARGLRLVEVASGDASIAHATAYCVLLENFLSGQIPTVSMRSQRLRRLGLELERLACHCGDLGAMAGDTGFLPTSAWNGRIRGEFLNLTAAICGNRFGREFLAPGGTEADISAAECAPAIAKLNDAARDFKGSCEVLFSSHGIRERFTGTGTVAKKDALALGITGVAARACGIAEDARFQMPLSTLPLYGSEPRTAAGGDVLARAEVRFLEAMDSLRLVEEDLKWLLENPRGKTDTPTANLYLPEWHIGAAIVEGWRGAVCHVAVTGAKGSFLAYKLIDPSFLNWPALALAMQGGQISDFPLCNKSFNLSYCGHDL